MTHIVPYLDTLLFIAALVYLAGGVRMVMTLRYLRSTGRPQTSMSPLIARRLPLVFLFYLIPILGLGYVLSGEIVTPPTAVLQIFITSLVFSVALTLTLLFYSFDMNARWDKAWVKFLDFPYLLLASVGLYRLLDALFATGPAAGKNALNVLSLTALSIALAIRLSKATIETFFDNWTGRNNPSDSTRGPACPCCVAELR